MLVWLDLETTGLDSQQDGILEVGVAVTTNHLSIVDEGSWLVAPRREALEAMSEFVHDMHRSSGLLDESRFLGMPTRYVDESVAGWIESQVPEGPRVLCGSSIHFDRGFIREYMPETEKLLHYRMIDVSTLKELTRVWHPERAAPMPEHKAHRALDDIRVSINELSWYREHGTIS